jgi:N,N'-diacetylbacillosaminyl-diphospho-undecaprenol alpha-1,3-N-acetylgalactosaminyltransferase
MLIQMICNTDGALYVFRQPIIRALIAGGHQVSTVSDEGVYFDRLRALGAEPLGISFSRDSTAIGANFKLMAEMRRVIRKVKPDVVHSFTHKAAIYGSLAAWAAGVRRIIVTITGLGTLFIREDKKSKLLRQALILQYRIALLPVRAVFFQNPDDRDLFLRLRILPEHKAILSNGSGIDLSGFARPDAARNSAARATLLAELGLEDSGQTIILFPARGVREKGFHEFYDAARLVNETSAPAFIFVHAGLIDTDRNLDADAVLRFAGQAGVRYIGFKDNIGDYMQASDVVCLPSYREGTPRSLIEALAHGKVIVTTDAPGCRETVIDGWNGHLCKVGSAASLAAKLLAVDRAMLDAAPARSRQLCEDKYDANHLVRITMQAYHGEKING